MTISEISFDTEVCESGQSHVEGCYRLDKKDWCVFYFTDRRDGRWWRKEPLILTEVVWPSGARGIEAVYPKKTVLNKRFVATELARILKTSNWVEVAGPDSLQMK